MRNLQVEELEPRLLLNGTRSSPQPHPQPSAGGTFTARVAEHSPFLDYGAHGGSPGQERSGEGWTGGSPSRSFAPRWLDGRAQEAPGPREATPEGPAAAAPPGAPDRALGADAVFVNIASETSSARPRGPTPSGLNNLVGASGVRLEEVAFPARSPALAVREGERVVSVPAPSGGPDFSFPGAEAIPPPARDEEPHEDSPALPSPPLSGVLAALPPVDLSALELGMRQFLDRLGRMGQDLAGQPDGPEPCLWVVAAATAAAAFEIARRIQRSEVRSQRSELSKDPTLDVSG